ncbi:MAG: DNA repair protein RecO [Deltaproteobacteria bacterium]|nr:DNA repair protein RecO [Deltaproteobacteria bacterium]
MVEERTPAVVLRARAYGESDKIVTLLTRDWGKVTGIAKGAKRSQRRFVNVLDSFTHVQLYFRPGRGNDLAFIFRCDLIRNFRAPSLDLERYAFASYVTELIDVMIVDREAGAEAYTLLLAGLTALEEEQVLSTLFLPAFTLLLLSCTGYEPNVTECQHCGVSIGEHAGPSVFSPSRGGLLCPRCHDHGGMTIHLSDDTINVLATAKTTPPEDFLRITTSPRTTRETRAVVTSLLSRNLTRPLKSQAFLEQMGALHDSHVDGPQGE